jgi:ribosomal protein S18 acetylase RimI-like enzyme
MIIRSARKTDAPQIVKIWLDLFVQHAGYKDPYYNKLAKNGKKAFEKFIKKSMTEKQKIVTVAEDKNKLVGYAFGRIEKRPPIFPTSREAMLADLGVDSAYRSKGIGHTLIKDFCRRSKAKGATLVILDVHEKNPRAVKFYAREGFRPHLIRMVKKI